MPQLIVFLIILASFIAAAKAAIISYRSMERWICEMPLDWAKAGTLRLSQEENEAYFQYKARIAECWMAKMTDAIKYEIEDQFYEKDIHILNINQSSDRRIYIVVRECDLLETKKIAPNIIPSYLIDWCYFVIPPTQGMVAL